MMTSLKKDICRRLVSSVKSCANLSARERRNSANVWTTTSRTFLAQRIVQIIGSSFIFVEGKNSSDGPQYWRLLNLEMWHSPAVLGSAPKYKLSMLVFLYFIILSLTITLIGTSNFILAIFFSIYSRRSVRREIASLNCTFSAWTSFSSSWYAVFASCTSCDILTDRFARVFAL